MNFWKRHGVDNEEQSRMSVPFIEPLMDFLLPCFVLPALNARAKPVIQTRGGNVGGGVGGCGGVDLN